jgi:exoribonuclease-2
MHVLFEEAGKFMAGRVLSEAEASSQVELDSGKRVKVKAANILIKFEKPAPAELLAQAAAVAETIELELAWEFAPEGEFSFADLARDYFSADATLAQQAGALFRLFEAPHYFRRAGKGRFKKAPAEILQQALAAIEKKKVIQQLITDWSAELAAGELPGADPRAAVQDPVPARTRTPPSTRPWSRPRAPPSCRRWPCCSKAGAIASPYQFHWQRFLLDHFPKGTGFPALQAPPITDDLPLAAVQAYSIDDSQTTEIDDALSVQGLGSGTVVWASTSPRRAWPSHPAAPSTCWGASACPRSTCRATRSPCCPTTWCRPTPCRRAATCPAVSLYVALDEATLEIKATETRLERVPIVANLRHDQLDGLITEAWLENPFEHQNAHQASADRS